VFDILTTPEGWNGWFTTKATFNAVPGGEVKFAWRDFGADHYTADDFGRVVSIQEDRELSFTWHPGEHETVVVFQLEPRGEGCMLSVQESGYKFEPTDVSVALQVATGWGEAITLLKFYAETGKVYGPVPR
jgi:uncharacterized protein YndB with AHSA1/START domain